MASFLLAQKKHTLRLGAYLPLPHLEPLPPLGVLPLLAVGLDNSHKLH